MTNLYKVTSLESAQADTYEEQQELLNEMHRADACYEMMYQIALHMLVLKQPVATEELNAQFAEYKFTNEELFAAATQARADVLAEHAAAK